MNCLFQPSLFFLSFLPLWLSVTFIDIMSLSKSLENPWTEIISLSLMGLATVVSILVVAIQVHHTKVNADPIKPTIKSAVKQRGVTAEYLLSYILPLFAFDFTQWEQVTLFLVFFATLSFLCIKHHYVYANIVLELRGYTCYDCTLLMVNGSTFDAVVISGTELTGMLNNPLVCVDLKNGYVLNLSKPTV